MNRKTRVIVVDDSALVRSLLAEIINRQPDMECIGTANDPLVAREMIRELNPDVITLDIEMPKMDGIDFLGRIMRLRPMPVLMISTLTERGAEITMRALELGAVDFVSKPRVGVANGLSQLSTEIVDKIRIAASAHVHRMVKPAATATDTGTAATARPAFSSATLLGKLSTEKLIAIGASTGGTEAIKEVLTNMPADAPAIVITQHMPPGFTTSFAARLDSLCQITVKEASNGERLLPGHAYIAPGGKQFAISRSGANYVAVVDEQAPPVNRHKPSVEVLFKSVAQFAGRNATGVMLTGMGADGAAAMREMKDAGSYNYVQDEASCIVFGMPREAIAHGAADEVLPLTQIAPALLTKLRASPDVRHRI
ncbi:MULTISPECIES: chemotaxis response regulator protein-glutamate methylesterase [Comamonas]|uniref:Protein-glutamate methylesterase/protein-glutamine glutaminase n=1 Tax=Comamonas avium TaxID=2762231 RepID=A0ABR8S910_9BURK|nr:MULTISPECIES: chemotaxis response regulator protein-glutamate methylesterase [Comamonas]MBD7959884.1 chemotaxis response regulator protein-glutamate methylesterase [Comamonas avium]MBD9403427.1 chemotaxis response regulator protein-glutamate methylesterase [Comamonas sp. CMM02]